MILLLGVAMGASVELSPGDDVGTLTSSLSAGDELVFNAGTYTLEGRLTWSGLGTEEAPIVLRAAEGAEVILEGGFNDYLAMVEDSSWLEVRGLIFQGTADREEDASPGGLRVHDSTQVVVSDNRFHDLNRTALYLSGDNSQVTVQHNEMHDLIRGNGIYVGCSDASCWTQDSTFALNWIHDLESENEYGMVFEHGSQGNYILDNVLNNIAYRGMVLGSTELGPANVVEGNAIWSVAHSALRVYGAAQVRNNVLFNCGSNGIVSDNPNRDTFQDQVITHNTIVDTEGYGIRIEDWDEATGMVLANNVVSNPIGRALYAEEDTITEAAYVSNNVVTGLVENLDLLAGHFIAGNGQADFMDAAAWDFYPTGTSALLNTADPAGDAWVPEFDFSGAVRDGASPDVGAFERDGASNPGWAIQEGFKQLGVETEGPETETVGGCCSEDAKGSAALLWLPLLGLGWRTRRRRGQAS